MPPTLPPLARDLLNTLLDRAEKPDRKTVIRVALDARQHATYFDRYDVCEAVHQAFMPLAEQGVLILHWQKGQDHLLDKIDLPPEGAPHLYALLGRTPRLTQEATLRALLQSQTASADWYAQFLQWASAQVDAHKSPAPLTLENAVHNRDLLMALAALAQLTEPTLERALSVRLFANSKRLEELRGDVLRVLHRFSPHAELFVEEDRALLAAHWLERVPEYVALAGPLELRVNGVVCNCAPFTPSLALPAPLLQSAEIVACAATALLTIENATTFAAVCRQRPPELLVIFTGGFASPALAHFLRRMHHALPHCTLWHWGDLDAGGFRILAHLRQFAPMQLLGNEPLLLTEHKAYLQPLTEHDRKNLAALAHHPQLADCQKLIATLLSENLKLEQELLDFSALWAKRHVAQNQ